MSSAHLVDKHKHLIFKIQVYPTTKIDLEIPYLVLNLKLDNVGRCYGMMNFLTGTSNPVVVVCNFSTEKNRYVPWYKYYTNVKVRTTATVGHIALMQIRGIC